MVLRKRVLVTAGNTRESIDPVRFISNISTGVMGFEISKAARDAGHRTVLISGPTLLRPPRGVTYVPIVSSADLDRAVRREFKRCDVLFMTSAVCDFRPAFVSRQKIKRKSSLNLRLVKTRDILKNLASGKKRQTVVGFCLETENLLGNARRKLREKKLDCIVANFLGRGSRPFGPHRTSVWILDRGGKTVEFRNATKARIAKFLIRSII
ncbi:MAG: phosphopantothenoylcysteine decarboxylase [Candidatus Omnitrophica bacterium]|nr:phosphopantothenoylcysteine decarboxylase [Candidatus Omnitrophota bacterium]